jgi:hypothetical protein
MKIEKCTGANIEQRNDAFEDQDDSKIERKGSWRELPSTLKVRFLSFA